MYVRLYNIYLSLFALFNLVRAEGTLEGWEVELRFNILIKIVARMLISLRA